MTTSTSDRSVGQFAAEFPASARVFEKHGIDFCCGGPDSPLRRLRQEGTEPGRRAGRNRLSYPAPRGGPDGLAGRSPPRLVDHILDTHHAYMKAQLPRVAALSSGAPSGSFHCGSVRDPIRMRYMEHDSAGEALVQLRRLTDNYALPEGACNTFRAVYFDLQEVERDLHRHINRENNIFFARQAPGFPGFVWFTRKVNFHENKRTPWVRSEESRFCRRTQPQFHPSKKSTKRARISPPRGI